MRISLEVEVRARLDGQRIAVDLLCHDDTVLDTVAFRVDEVVERTLQEMRRPDGVLAEDDLMALRRFMITLDLARSMLRGALSRESA